MTLLEVGDIKMLRETLCVVEGLIHRTGEFHYRKEEHANRIAEMIRECDKHRPLGVDGKHSNLHTDTCGCEDKGPRETWGTVKLLLHYQINYVGGSGCGMYFGWIDFANNPEDVSCPACLAFMSN